MAISMQLGPALTIYLAYLNDLFDCDLEVMFTIQSYKSLFISCLWYFITINEIIKEIKTTAIKLFIEYIFIRSSIGLIVGPQYLCLAIICKAETDIV